MGAEEKTLDPISHPTPDPNPNPDPTQPPPAARTLETEKGTGDMARASTSLAPNPSWFTPKRSTFIFLLPVMFMLIFSGYISM